MSVLQNSDEGCKMARVAFEDAISERVSVEVPQLQFIDEVTDVPVGGRSTWTGLFRRIWRFTSCNSLTR